MSRERDKAREEAIKIHQGETLPLGSVVAHPSDHMTYKLIEYDGDFAVLSRDGVTKRFPANEIFDPNRVQNTAMRIYGEIMIAATRSN